MMKVTIMKVKGLIDRVSRASITIKAAPDWNYDDYLKQWRPLRNPVTMTLTIDPTLIDKAIASYTNLLELQIKDGKVTQIKKVKPPPPSPPTDIDLIITGKPKSLRRAVLEALEQLTNQEGMVSKDTLMAELGKKGILPEEGNRLISVLMREGTIYEPKDGYLKKT
jgi:hypothetical protein